MKNLYILIAIFSFLFPLTAQATVAGKVVYHSGEAWALRDGERVALQKGVEVHSGDVIVTTMHGRAKLSMVDDSVVYVGRQSRITIDKYEMQKGSLLSGSFNMLWGKVRFLVAKLNTGGSSFSVQTKTATIGVRGTQFAVLVNPPSVVPKPSVKVPDSALLNAATTVMLFEGAVVGRSIKGQSVNIKPGTIVRLKPNGAILSRKIQNHDMKVLDIEPLALGKGALKPGKRALRSPTRLEPATTKLDSTATKLKPTTATRLEPTANKFDSTTLISPTRLESATLVKDPTLSPTTRVKDPSLSSTRPAPTGTVGTKLPSTGTIGTKLPSTGTIGTRLPSTGTIGTRLPSTGTIGIKVAPPPPPTIRTKLPSTGTIGTRLPSTGTIRTKVAP